MEIAVKWIFQLVKTNVGPIEAGQKPSLCFKGRKHMLCVSAGYPVRVLKRPAEDFARMRDVFHKGEPYPIAAAIAQLRRIAQTNGISAGAEKLLQRAEMERSHIDDEEQFQDEEDQAMPESPESSVKKEVESNDQNPTNDQQEKKVSTRKAKAKAKKTVAKKANGKAAPKKDKGPSRISRAVEFMKEEVKKAGGQKNLERGWRKDLFERAAKKFDLSPATCGIQYNKQVLK